MREGAVDHDAHRLGWACRMENVDCEAAKRTLCVDASQKATLQGFEALVKCCLGSRCPIYFRFYPCHRSGAGFVVPAGGPGLLPSSLPPCSMVVGNPIFEAFVWFSTWSG